MKFSFILFFVLFNLSCSHYGSINLKKHQFASRPQKIIWLHLPGFHEEHISLLKFFYKSSDYKTSFENATCFGKAWRYNLYDIRPKSDYSFLSQAIGTKNIKNSCDVYSFRPIWSYMSDFGYVTGILERSHESKGLLRAKSCSHHQFLSDTILWKMSRGKGESFHSQESRQFSKGKVYYDKSCQQGKCFNSIFSNVKSIIRDYFSNKKNYFFVIKDDIFLQSLKKRDLKQTKELLLEIERMFEYLLVQQQNHPDMLVVLSTSDPVPVELPLKGREWSSLIKGKNNLIYKKTSVVSPVWASGPRAENYCGMYEEAEFLKRTMQNFTKERLVILGLPIM